MFKGYAAHSCETKGGTKEVSEVQEVVAWRCAAATAPLCLAAESGSSEPQWQSPGQTSKVDPLTGYMWIYAEGHMGGSH